MGRMKEWFADDIQRQATLNTCRTIYPDNPTSSFAEWCEWLAASRQDSYKPDAALSDQFMRRLADAKHIMKNDTDPYGLSYHLFEMESALEKLIRYLNSNKL